MGRNWTRRSIEELVKQYAMTHGYGPGPGPAKGIKVTYPVAYGSEITKYAKYSEKGYLDSFGYEMDISDTKWREPGLTPYVEGSVVLGGLDNLTFKGGAGVSSDAVLDYFMPRLDTPDEYLPNPYNKYSMAIYCYIEGVFQKISLMTMYSYGIDTSSMMRLLRYSANTGDYAYVYKINSTVWNSILKMILDIERVTGTMINSWYILYRNMGLYPYDNALPRIPAHICDIAWDSVPEYNGIKEEENNEQ